MTKLFTLSGGHLFSLYDGCREEGIELVDTRHEQAAAFAAEGWAKVTREPGVAALTAGPGRHERDERDGVGAAEQLAARRARRPRARRCAGGRARCRRSTTSRSCGRSRSSRRPREATADIPGLITDALTTALAPHSGPTFLDFPLDVVFMEAEDEEPTTTIPSPADEPAATRRASSARSRCCATPSAR